MENTQQLNDKKILVVDDEADVVESLEELLEDTFAVDSASSFEEAVACLKNNTYDAAILDIMGVDGFRLLGLVEKKGIPALMLTAHAISAESLVKSLRKGAYAYIPKHEMANVDRYLVDVIHAKSKGGNIPQKWFNDLTPFFDRKFGPEWKNTHRETLEHFNLSHTREELEKIL